jgi:protein involved in polysaccharide export with SLBB domain
MGWASGAKNNISFGGALSLKYFVSLICVIILYMPGYSQDERSAQERASVFDFDLEQAQRSNEQMAPQPQLLEQALEQAIDSTRYILGPGDQLLIKIWGVLDQQFISPITAEGFIIIPSVAEVNIGGKTLAEASQSIKAELSKSFRNSNFSIRLVRMRKFRVYIVGEIQNPGTYYLRSVDRLVDAIQLAGGALNWGDETRIQVRHLDGTSDTVNVSEFYVDGNLEENIFLRGGDVIFIPRIDLSKNYVIITGNVGSQGIYQTLEKETLYEFLKRVKALNRNSNIANVILIRDTTKLVFNFLQNEVGAQQEDLETGDRIIIPSLRDRVYVKGEVYQPGPYPYLANYSARDYAGYAGMLGTSTDINKIYVIRANTNEIDYGPDIIVNRGDTVIIPKSGRENVKDVMAIITPIISITISTVALIIAAGK